jgi:hypothetical protein
MLILMWNKGRPMFHCNKVSSGYFTVTFSSVLVMAEIFDCSDPHNALYL